MNLSINNFKINHNTGMKFSNQRICRYSNLEPLRADTISFGALKKSQFSGIDLFVVNKFKAPIERFKCNDDLQKWCQREINKLNKKDLSGRQEEITIQRKATFKEWLDYVTEENDAYNSAIAFLVLSEIVKDIDTDNDREIPPLNKGVLAQTIDDIDKRLREKPKAMVNFNTEYRKNLQNISLDNLKTNLNSNKTGWVLIPSKGHDAEHFEENVDKLKTLSCRTWCTSSFNAEPYLLRGDFHIYLENGEPKLGVRFISDVIVEIQGEKNNSKIPVKYMDIAYEHTKNNKLSNSTQNEFEKARAAKEKALKLEEKLKKEGLDFKTCSKKQLLEACGINCEVDSDGFLILDKYKQPDKDFAFDDLGINENNLFKSIKKIKGDADFSDSRVTHLGSLESIDGKANFYHSMLKNLGNLQFIGGDAVLFGSQVRNFGNLQFIGGSVDFRHAKIINLGNLQTIGGSANFSGSNVTDLGNLQFIGGSANFSESKVKNLKNLRTIGMDACFDNNSQVINLGKLEHIGGRALFEESKITSLRNLRSISGSADFSESQITDLGNLRSVGGVVTLTDTQLTPDDFRNVKVTGRIIGASYI